MSGLSVFKREKQSEREREREEGRHTGQSQSARWRLSLHAIVAYHMIKTISYWSGTRANSSAM